MDFHLPGQAAPLPPRGSRPASGFRPRSATANKQIPTVGSPMGGTWQSELVPTDVGDPAVLEYAKYVGLYEHDSDLLWLAYCGLHLPLPAGWTQHDDSETGAPYFYHEATGQSSYEHPSDAHMRFMVAFLREHHDEMDASLGLSDLRRQLRAEIDSRMALEGKLRRAADVAAQQAMEYRQEVEAARREGERAVQEAQAETALVRAQLHPDDVAKAGARVLAHRTGAPEGAAPAADVWHDALEAAQRRNAAALEEVRRQHAEAEAGLLRQVEAAREEARREGALALASVQAALEQAHADGLALQRERDKMRELVDQTDRALRSMDDERAGLEVRLSESRQANDRLRAQTDEFETIKGSLGQRVHEVQERVRETEELLGRRTEELLGARGALAEAEARLAEEVESRKKLAHMLARSATEFGEERDAFRTRLQAAEAVYEEEKARARGQVAEAEAALEAQRGETARCEGTIEELRGELRAAADTIADLQAKVDDADATLGKKYKLVVDGLEIEKRALEQRLERVSRAASEAATAHAAERSGLQADLLAARNEAADLRHRLQLALAEKEEVIASAERFQAAMEERAREAVAREAARGQEREAAHERERSEWRVLLAKEQEERRVEVAAAVRAIAEEKLRSADVVTGANAAVDGMRAQLEETAERMREAARMEPEKLAELVEGVRREMQEEVREALARAREAAREDVAAFRAEGREVQEKWRAMVARLEEERRTLARATHEALLKASQAAVEGDLLDERTRTLHALERDVRRLRRAAREPLPDGPSPREPGKPRDAASLERAVADLEKALERAKGQASGERERWEARERYYLALLGERPPSARAAAAAALPPPSPAPAPGHAWAAATGGAPGTAGAGGRRTAGTVGSAGSATGAPLTSWLAEMENEPALPPVLTEMGILGTLPAIAPVRVRPTRHHQHPAPDAPRSLAASSSAPTLGAGVGAGPAPRNLPPLTSVAQSVHVA